MRETHLSGGANTIIVTFCSICAPKGSYSKIPAFVLESRSILIESDDKEMAKKKIKSADSNAVGIKALAQHLGISIGTASRALNNRYGVSQATRERVLETAKELGYVPDSAARSMKGHPSCRVGLLFAPYIDKKHGGKINPAALRTLEAIQSEADERQLFFEIIKLTETLELETELKELGLDAIITYGHFAPSHFKLLDQLQLPSVLIQHESRYKTQASLLINTQESGYNGTQYLAALGHRSIGFVTGPRGERHSGGFADGVLDAIKEFKLHCQPTWDIELSAENVNEDDSYETLKAVLKKKRIPSAWLFASDWTAIGGMRAIQEVGLSIPDDISVIGYDDINRSSRTQPPLTTFKVELEPLACAVLDLASSLIKRDDNARDILKKKNFIIPRLIKRATCSCKH